MSDETGNRLLQQGMGVLLDLAHRARHAGSSDELAFQIVNDSHQLAPYRQAVLWLAGEGVITLSGVVQIEANAPYVHFLQQLCPALAKQPGMRPLQAEAAGSLLADEWPHWLPAHVLWLPFASQQGTAEDGALLLARDTPWLAHEQTLLQEWADSWAHAFFAHRRRERGPLRLWWAELARGRRGRRKWWYAALALVVLAGVPVRLSVLAPGELAPARPALVRAPMDGVIARLLVQPNEAVQAGQALLVFDETELSGRLEISLQNLATAEAEYRQIAQSAVADSKYNSQLAALQGRVEQGRAESEYWQAQLLRSRLLAPQDGIALFGDANEWAGKPVLTGERIMRIAAPGDVEIEAWLGVGDAIPLPDSASAVLYLNADPLHPVPARLRYIAHEAVQRPDGSYAYRVRAVLQQVTGQRVGQKGTLKLSGARVPLIYWVLRRPLALLRQTVGW